MGDCLTMCTPKPIEVMVVDDEKLDRLLIEKIVSGQERFSVRLFPDGAEGWDALVGGYKPDIILLDWEMPGIDGLEFCRRLREGGQWEQTFVIMVTARREPEDIVAGLEVGANDYVRKPFNQAELKARLDSAARVVGLQQDLRDKVEQLEESLAQVRQLKGLLPICSYCKRIRNDDSYWQQVEDYLSEQSDAEFSHSICPDCYEKHVKPQSVPNRKEAR